MLNRKLRIQYSLLCSKLGYPVAAMYAAKGDIFQLIVELCRDNAPNWLVANILHFTRKAQ